jgi:hypothetical protein
MKEKCIVLFSGGLDSRLAIKLMQKRDFEVLAVYFKLPFVKHDEKSLKEFSKKEKFRLKIFDCTKGKLLQEYLKIIKKAKYGTGVGVNPCIDCRIFMLKKAKKFADEKKINLIVTGEVLGQRPMSQHKRGLEIVEKESRLGERLVRPLSEYDIHGRRRDKQMTLAKKFKIEYPFPAGGCLLCEKELKGRLKFLLDKGLNEEEVQLVGIGRHFLIDDTQGGHTQRGHENLSRGENPQAGCWIVVGKNEEENKIIEDITSGKVIVPDFKGPSAVIFDKCKKQTKEKVNELIKVYSKGNLKDRKKFEKFKL